MGPERSRHQPPFVDKSIRVSHSTVAAIVEEATNFAHNQRPLAKHVGDFGMDNHVSVTLPISPVFVADFRSVLQLCPEVAAPLCSKTQFFRPAAPAFLCARLEQRTRRQHKIAKLKLIRQRKRFGLVGFQIQLKASRPGRLG